ncbi:MAG TPA: hypothetical protein VM165_04185 [Planctomycetaceae bacterium]|nr:hypothetical protein [Planctomycetaceae bacterium]
MMPLAEVSDFPGISELWLHLKDAVRARQRRNSKPPVGLKQDCVDAALAFLDGNGAALKAVALRLRCKSANDKRPPLPPGRRGKGKCPPSHRAVAKERLAAVMRSRQIIMVPITGTASEPPMWTARHDESPRHSPEVEVTRQ